MDRNGGVPGDSRGRVRRSSAGRPGVPGKRVFARESDRAPRPCPMPWRRGGAVSSRGTGSRSLSRLEGTLIRLETAYRVHGTGCSACTPLRRTVTGKQRVFGVRRGLARRDAQQSTTHCDSRRLPGRLALAPVARSWSFRTLRAAAHPRQSTLAFTGRPAVRRVARPTRVSVAPDEASHSLLTNDPPRDHLHINQIRTFTPRAPLHKNTVGLLASGHNQGAGQAANYANMSVDDRAPTRRFSPVSWP